MVNLAKLKACRQDQFWKYGFFVPRMYGQAVDIDLANGNRKW
jgi:hypothetical protein